ncbi:pentatricopeptide repeat-containing protein At1g53600, mitochondrial-like [Phragmites australis]|uniref:pentatricopeptide repeat-containing protein At1g53600, mitochondrial-like n=1 Tax=Phragmites australis TaxID=29695 RepID=UPI002D77CE73|nr:pentatricopeptide repeat-containing protein At1g53600, mitochondrial-like [Phragmites australis]XP_062192574.1 pentatricopeptide repeat-containing protein At1g53600, mitochondrial-like [Phragmites australis]XP_062192576.1 pentatricopeptide repeat-containing protein At1g53600, mitochondrial-like [Phragmites australis]XP_062192577.1 pentatricopeptide repeat-containing protein At1g53600, mitochondrial-like [Phragmites australis]
MAALRLPKAPATAALAGVSLRLPPLEQLPPRHPNTAHLNALLTAYGRRGRIRDAQRLFDRMPRRDVISWTALLTAYADGGDLASARLVFDDMPRRNAASWNALLSVYLRAARPAAAHAFFAKMPAKNAVSYGAMISGLAKAGMLHEAQAVYGEMPPRWRDPVGSNAMMAGYLRAGELGIALRMFEGMAVRDVISWSAMVDGLCKYGTVSDARRLFEAMPERNVVSWTSMIRGYVKRGMCRDGLLLFLDMRHEGVQVNTTTLSVVLDACAEACLVIEGIQIHSLIIAMGFEVDIFLGDSIIIMYSRFGWMVDARREFACMKQKDIVSWNSLITGYVQNNMIEEAHVLFKLMPERDAVSCTSMVVGFSNRGWMREAVELFEQMPGKDEIAWTAVISSFIANGDYVSAVRWFCRMTREGCKSSTIAFSCFLSALASLGMLNQGMQAHAYAVSMGWLFDSAVHTSLVTMYAKCGRLTEAHRIFSSISNPNLIATNSMITAFAQHGLAEDALKLFSRMQNDGQKPNHVTFLGILTACARAGLIQQGYDYFESMRAVYGIEPNPDHYTCMVDLLGRVGFLAEALEMINSMPQKDYPDAWAALLSSSSLHSNLAFAKIAAQKLLEMDPYNAIAYMVLSSMFSSAGMKDDEEMLKVSQLSNMPSKSPAYSLIIQDRTTEKHF